MAGRRTANLWLYMDVLYVACTLLCISILSDELRQKHREQPRRPSKPAFRTIKSPDGDMIDCILVSEQPALDHPLLKDHKIQMQPTGYDHQFVERKSVSAEDREGDHLGIAARGVLRRGSMDGSKQSQDNEMHQLWHHAGLSCPQGTIAVRRSADSDVQRNYSLMHGYGRKFHLPPQPSPVSATPVGASGHQHAIGYVEGGTFYGAKANINVWNPSVQVSNEFSLSQIWLLGGSFNNDLNSIEAGWQVSPDLYGDNNTRLFIYWTSDSYQTTGCYNLLCSGFVQVSSDIALGATILPVSSYDSSQYDITILIWKDPKQGNWWMQFANKYILGYWPAALFTSLSTSANMVEWGGEVVNSEPGGQHTSTQMGSGYFPSDSFGKCAYFSHLMVVDSTNKLKPPGGIGIFAERPSCYNVQTGSSSDWGNYFYYGGPGRNPDCP